MCRVVVTFALVVALLAGQALASPCIHRAASLESWLEHNAQPHFHVASDCRDHDHHDALLSGGSSEAVLHGASHDHDHNAIYLPANEYTHSRWCRGGVTSPDDFSADWATIDSLLCQDASWDALVANDLACLPGARVSGGFSLRLCLRI